jgi:hypothetical protein
LQEGEKVEKLLKINMSKREVLKVLGDKNTNEKEMDKNKKVFYFVKK